MQKATLHCMHNICASTVVLCCRSMSLHAACKLLHDVVCSAQFTLFLIYIYILHI